MVTPGQFNGCKFAAMVGYVISVPDAWDHLNDKTANFLLELRIWTILYTESVTRTCVKFELGSRHLYIQATWCPAC